MTAHVLLDRPLTDLPDALQRVLDPSSRLGLVLPETPPRVFPSLLWALLAGLSGLIFAAGVPAAAPALAWFYGLIAVGCGLVAIRPGRRAFRALRDRWALTSGRYRRGLYVLPEGLLLWNGATATWIAREAVEALHRVADSGGPPHERLTVLKVKVAEGEHLSVPLDMIPPTLGEDDGSPRFKALQAWIETGRFEPLPTPSPPWREQLKPWILNLCLGHLVLGAVGIFGLLSLTALSHVLGRPLASLTGLLLGVPLFFGFPVILHRTVGSRLHLSAVDGRPTGWGYLLLLGLSALFLIILGGHGAATLWWQLRADEYRGLTFSDLENADSTPAFFQWPEPLHPLKEPVGYDVHRLFLGDASWVESSAYVVPLVDSSQPTPGCLWLGLATDDGSRSAASIRRLLSERSDWLVQASGLEASSFASAVDDAVSQLSEPPACATDFKVLTASPSRSSAIRASVQHLGLLHALVHGLPLIALWIWAIGKLDRLRPEIQDRRSSYR